MGNVDVDVVIRLLSLLLQRPMRKTELWRLSKLNYYSFERYLLILIERGLVAERDGLYHLTEKGTRETLAILEWLCRVLY
ncbi:winged helix-turn-helix domain-containing protein [Pyrobaculum aerophilum]|uniref:ArnR1-like winged helix-turn-helix domain-containing protein n=1 Tax=Pyrobaculum aerophilum TaxID=13773 RepID=A0A371R2X2_9CREN|nr:winged helix-turn-helix domain-containing protein [Pyrobaculum aerophilum]RFA98116.1 hypothetical protein CGL51_01980 [Pyrobaculum aerophilum]RFA99022.1 hypothetical protein CGL52_05915 [Pyrobaculum aerophilum]